MPWNGAWAAARCAPYRRRAVRPAIGRRACQKRAFRENSKVRLNWRPASIVVVSVSLAAALGGAPVRAASGVTVRSSSVLPQQPPIGGVVRLSLDLVNDSTLAWGPHDTVRIRWVRSGQTALEATQPLGRSVAAGGEATLAMVTLAPSAVGAVTPAVDRTP